MRQLVLALAAVTCAGNLLHAVTKKDTVQRTFTLPGGAAGRELQVDNIFGSITVTAHAGPTIEMVANQTIKADDDEALQNAQRDVRLDITQAGNSVKIIVDGPFRNRHGTNWDSDQLRYTVAYDFELKVPVETALKLKTVNNGGISVSGVNGSFELRNVNGRIDMKDVAGSGSAATVNGPVLASFTQAPNGPVKFKTVNGELELAVPSSLNADVSVKTMNGDLYTDFDVTQLAGKVMTMEAGARKSWRSNRGGNLRFGAGGPEMTFDTLNGDIRILKR
jgi:putative adhesin